MARYEQQRIVRVVSEFLQCLIRIAVGMLKKVAMAIREIAEL